MTVETVKKLLYGHGDLGKYIAFTLTEQNELVEEEMQLSRMYSRALWGRDSVYSGSQFVLKKWAEMVDSRQMLPSKM